MMLKYRIESLPTGVKQAILNSEDVKVKALKGYEVVTKVYTCQAYCLYLSNKCELRNPALPYILVTTICL